jgi:hypothetical protein
MTIAVTDPDVALDGLQHQALDVHAVRMLLHIPKVGGSGCLSTDLLAGDNVSHPRTSVRYEGR